jgi:uncharacterized protein YdeI (YjbR/CyaY-like superfamily)
MEAIYFDSAADLRRWLEEHHDRASELLIGFHRKSSGRPRLSYPEAVEEALCFGWIDGITRRVDLGRWAVRFTPRKARSNWSLINTRRAAQLEKEGRMAPAGLRAYEARDRTRSGAYTYEQRFQPFESTQEATFRRNARAWSFFQAQPPSYRRAATLWVISAKREETRQRRLANLIEHSNRGERLPALTSPARPPGRGRERARR